MYWFTFGFVLQTKLLLSSCFTFRVILKMLIMNKYKNTSFKHFVGVLASGVPRSTCWKAQLRPIYINTTSSSSTSSSTRRAQDPRGWVSRGVVQNQPGEGFTEDLAEHHRLSKDAAQASSPRNHHQERGGRGSLPSKRPSTTIRAPRVKA